MASCIMHIAVAKKVYEKINNDSDINQYDYFLGSIAPDLSKCIGENKIYSHFINEERGIPNIDTFLTKYHLDNSFNLGYYTHLYTDLIFYKDFLPLFYNDSEVLLTTIKTLDGENIRLDHNTAIKILYNDYTNLNELLINEYNLSLDIFYNDFKRPITDITEINIDKLNILIDKMGIIIENSTNYKEYLIDISSIKSFINDCVDEIYNNLKVLEII